MTDTVPSPEFVTHTRAPSGLTTTPMGAFPTFAVAITVFVAVSITDTVFSCLFATYTRVPSGVTTTPMGTLPTATVAPTVFVETSRTDTSLPISLLMYANGAAPAPAAPAKTTAPASHSAGRSPLMFRPPLYQITLQWSTGFAPDRNPVKDGSPPEEIPYRASTRDSA